MSVVHFPSSVGTKLRRDPRRYLDAGVNELLRQYRETGQVRSEATLLQHDGSVERISRLFGIPERGNNSWVNSVGMWFHCSDVVGGYAIIPVRIGANNYVYVDGRDGQMKALSLFWLEGRTGDPRHDLALITHLDGPLGRDRFKYAQPSNWTGRKATIPFGAPEVFEPGGRKVSSAAARRIGFSAGKPTAAPHTLPPSIMRSCFSLFRRPGPDCPGRPQKTPRRQTAGPARRAYTV